MITYRIKLGTCTGTAEYLISEVNAVEAIEEAMYRCGEPCIVLSCIWEDDSRIGETDGN